MKTRWIKKLSFVLAALLCCVFSIGTCFAESIENTIVEAQLHFDELFDQYKDDLSEQERFAANRIFDAIGDSSNVEALRYILNADDLPTLQTIINNGFFSPNQLPMESNEEMTAILQKATQILQAANLPVSPCNFVEALHNGYYVLFGSVSVEYEILYNCEMFFEAQTLCALHTFASDGSPSCLRKCVIE